MKKPYYLTNDGIQLVVDTANLVCESQGWATRIHENEVIPIVMALYIIKKVIKTKNAKTS